MIDYETMIKALRLSWLKRITDEESSGFWKSYLDYLLENQGGLFLFQCNYDISISTAFYQELLIWWSNIREIEDPNNIYKYIIRNNKEIKIDGKSVFYKHYFDKNIIYTSDLLYDMSNTESFKVVRGIGLTRSSYLVWTGLRQNCMRVNIPSFQDSFEQGNFKCHNYYCYLIKQKLENPSKWVKLREEFNLEHKQVSEAFLLPVRVASEPNVRSFQYKVLNSILFTNDLLCKIVNN